MIKFENTEVVGWEHAIRGMRNPMNSWDKSDTIFVEDREYHNIYGDSGPYYSVEEAPYGEQPVDGVLIGMYDLDLMKRLRNAGTDHRKFMRMIAAYVDITAPLYWWKEFDTYKVGTVTNSCSTMHKIHEKEFTLEDFSYEHLNESSIRTLEYMIEDLNYWRYIYINGGIDDNYDGTSRIYNAKDKDAWWQMIQLLPSSYNQKRTVMMNYEVLANIYKSRKNHKLDEWAEHSLKLRDHPKTEKELKKRMSEPLCTPEFSRDYFGFCDWIKTLPYSELITGELEAA